MRTRLVTTIAIAATLALPVGAAVAGGGDDSGVTEDSVEVAASPDVRAPASRVDVGARMAAHPRADDLRTRTRPERERPQLERPDANERPRTSTFRAADAGVVTLTWSRDAILDVQVRPADGWQHDTVRRDRRTVAIRFTSRADKKAVTFAAYLGRDGQLRTQVHVRSATDRPASRTGTFRAADAGAVTVTWNRDAILDVQVRPADSWRYDIERRDRRTVLVTFADGDHRVLFLARIDESGELKTRVDGQSSRGEEEQMRTRERDEGAPADRG